MLVTRYVMRAGENLLWEDWALNREAEAQAVDIPGELGPNEDLGSRVAGVGGQISLLSNKDHISERGRKKLVLLLSDRGRE